MLQRPTRLSARRGKKRQKNPQLSSRRIGRCWEIQRAPLENKAGSESQRISAARQKLNETPGSGGRSPGRCAALVIQATQTASSLSHVATQKCGAANKICASMDGQISGKSDRLLLIIRPPCNCNHQFQPLRARHASQPRSRRRGHYFNNFYLSGTAKVRAEREGWGMQKPCASYKSHRRAAALCRRDILSFRLKMVWIQLW